LQDSFLPAGLSQSRRLRHFGKNKLLKITSGNPIALMIGSWKALNAETARVLQRVADAGFPLPQTDS
jgi:hypothetical protein